MRVILVGAAVDRLRLRGLLDPAASVVGECASLDDARRIAHQADAVLLAPTSLPGAEPVAPGFASAAEEPLTPRELEVLDLMAEGLPNKAIAARLGISDQTVKFHAASIIGKLGATNRTEAVRRAMRRGLVIF